MLTNREKKLANLNKKCKQLKLRIRDAENTTSDAAYLQKLRRELADYEKQAEMLTRTLRL